MAAKGMTANDFARAGFLKPLRRTLMGLELRHRNSLDPYWKELSIACGGVSDGASRAERIPEAVFRNPAQLGLAESEYPGRQPVFIRQRAAEHRRVVGVQHNGHARIV
jgi:hypothetical protein